MRAPSTSQWFTFALRVNGVVFREAALRQGIEGHSNLEVVIRDPKLGSFALHEEFLLEVLESVDNTRWRPVSFAELKAAALERADKAACDPCPRITTPQGHAEPPKNPMGGIIARIPVEGDSSHIGRADEALTRAGIRFEIVGGVDSRGRSACHVTLVVCSLVGAVTSLRHAGFRESPESKYVLVDSPTGWKVRLLQGRPRRSRRCLKEVN